MDKFEIDEVINSITRISSKRSYWFVRTQGGIFYETFLENSFIAIGYDTIRLSTIKNAFQNKHGKKALTQAVRERFPEENRPGYIGNQLIDFAYNIKKGDVVVIPSTSSSYISIGEVESTPVFEVEEGANEANCPFLKRKKVNWIKTNINLQSIDAQLLRLKYTQRTVTYIPEDLTSFIDRILIPLYVKDDNAHLALNVQRHEHLPAYHVFSAWMELLKLADEFGTQEDLNIEKEEFDLKINVQSPGTIEFISYSVVGLVILSIIVAAIIGAEFEADSKYLKFKFKSEGLLKKVSDFLDKKQSRIIQKNLNQKLKMMEINPEELLKILQQVNKKGKGDDESIG